MTVLALRLNSWRDTRILVDQLPGWTFRGQQNAAWPLTTTLQRAGEQDHYGTGFLVSAVEIQIMEEFKRRAHHFLPAPPQPEDLIEWMALIQHFGGPTRLLDFTKSFYIAAFFAVEKASTECAVWCINHDAMARAAGPVPVPGTVPYWQTVHETERAIRTAQEVISRYPPSTESFVYEVHPFRVNERLAVQQGLFLCPACVDVSFVQSLAGTFGLTDSAFLEPKIEIIYQPATHTRKLFEKAAAIKVLLPQSFQYDVLDDLWKMNISAASLFPGLDGFARSLHYFVRAKSLWHIKFDNGGFDPL
jgi:hypothetical protein